MIMHSNPSGGPWKRASCGFFIFNSLTLVMLWMVFDIVKKPQEFTGWAWGVVLLISIMLYVFEIAIPVKRLRSVILILGIFVALPGFLFFAMPIFMFFELAGMVGGKRIVFLSSYLSPVLIWSIFQSIRINKVRIRENYFEKEVLIQGPSGYFDADNADDLGDLGKTHVKRLSGKSRFSLAFFLVSVTYPLQRYLSGIGDYAALFLVMGLLSLVILIYTAGKICSGYVLWIYLAGKFERENKIKIFLKS